MFWAWVSKKWLDFQTFLYHAFPHTGAVVCFEDEKGKTRYGTVEVIDFDFRKLYVFEYMLDSSGNVVGYPHWVKLDDVRIAPERLQTLEFRPKSENIHEKV